MVFLDLETSCTSQELANIFGIVGRLLTLICFVVPILLIISYIYKFIKLVQNPEEKNGIKKIINSGLALIIVFFIPLIVDVSMKAAGEKYNISSCWLLAKENRFSTKDVKYVDIYSSTERKKFLADSSLYEAGVARSDSAYFSGSGGITAATGEKLVAAARTQIGLPYYSMHYGPKEGDGLGFGCAMFVSYCYNQVFFGGVSGQTTGLGGFYGSTWEYWGNVTRDGYDAYNKKFVEVSAADARPGDVIAFLRGGDHYSSAQNCYHVGLYSGNGKIIDSSYYGVGERSVNIHSSEYHFLRFVGRP